jgi:hypothetical protein
VRYILVVVVCFGCTAQSSGVTLGGPCSLDEQCAEGGVCDYSAADPICIDAAADPDGDGIPNSMDHCPNGPGGMYDEDHDGIGDDCDRCPIAPPPAVPDADGDAVDSPCDPDPKTAGDTILLFEGFNAPLDTTVWNASTPDAWTVEGGELVVRLGAVPTEDFMSTNVNPAANLAVETSYRVDKLEASATTHLVAAGARDTRPAGVASFECGVVHSDVGGAEDVVDLETNQGANSHSVALTAFDSARLYRAAASSTGTTVGCTVIGDNMPVGTVQGSITPDALGQVSLAARAVTARYQWLLVVGR